MKIKLTCDKCGKEFERHKKRTLLVFCSLKCKNDYFRNKTNIEVYGVEKANEISIKISITSNGKNNGNYGKFWTDEQKIEQSRKITKKYKDNSDLRFKVGASNRGVKFSQERINLMHKHRTTESYQHSHTEERKRKISIQSAINWKNPKFIAKSRLTREEKGQWVPLSQKSDLNIYYKEANWVSRMWDLVENSILKEIGIFNSKTNTKGAVRDHKFGRLLGFELGVFPEILRHPANCQIISHSANSGKRTSRYIDRNDIMLDELFEQIKKYERNWKEQEVCLQRIDEYINGKRWINQYKENKS
jgi:hypothetical protein